MTHVNIANAEAPPVTPLTYRAIYDVNGNVLYEAWADPKNPDVDEAVWCIRKHTYDESNNRTLSEWADGNGKYDNVFTRCETLITFK